MGDVVGRPESMHRYGGGVSSRTPHRFGPADLALLLASILPTVAGAFARGGEFGPIHLVILAVSVVLLYFRRRAPIPALGVGVVALLASVAVTERPNGLFPVVIALVFTVAVCNERRVGVSAGIAGMVGLLGSIAILALNGLFGPEVLAAVAWPALAVAAGDVVRNRRLAVEAAEERVRRAEETREQEARRRVAEERLRIARELHDVVAHRMAVVNVQAGVAAHLLRERPDDAEQALQVVRSSAQHALDELGGILSVLRTTADDGAPTEPTPTVADLPALIRSFEDAGLDVTWETSGSPKALGESVQLGLYRTVQEGLTNAHKHGDGRAHVALAYRDDGIHVVIENEVAAVGRDDATAGSGFGLIGMRERIHAVGGTIDAAPDGAHRFRVAAHFPTDEGIPS